ncbi:MAG: PIN domain-containing protein [Bacteroidetes bacterium]|nr:PIN domain-containing protein [Bacteroidota bacterium]
MSKSEDSKLRQLINDCFLLEWNSKIKEKTIDLKRKYNVKLPDAIIAATSLAYQIPLVTADKGFSKIKDLDLVILEM